MTATLEKQKTKRRALTKEEFDDYLNSEVHRKKEEIGNRKIKQLVIDNRNRTLEKKATYDSSQDNSDVAAELKEVCMTKEAYDKAITASKLVCELSGKEIELYFFLINKLSAYQNNDHVIRDVYIAKEQKVNIINCTVETDGVLFSKRDMINNLESRIVGWAHSHGEGETYHSPTDRRQLKTSLRKYGIDKQISSGDKEWTSYNFNIRYFPSIVINAKGSKPSVWVVASYTRWVYDIETDSIKSEKVLQYNEDIALNLIDETNSINLNKEEIKRQLLERVIIEGKGRLSDICKIVKETEDNVSKDKTTPSASVEKKPPVASKKKSTLSLQKRIQSLEAKYNELKTNYTTLMADYKKQKTEYTALQSRVDRLEELNKKRTPCYREDMKKYYAPLISSKNKEQRTIGTIAKILSGEYRGSLKNIKSGNLEEDPTSSRIYKWEDRIKAVKLICTKNKKDIISLGKKPLSRLFDVINRNRYVTKKYKSGVSRLKRLLYNA